MALHPDGRAPASIAGELRRFFRDGTPDNSFARPTGSSIHQVEVMPDDSVIASGIFAQAGGTTASLARWFPNGRRDTAFERVPWRGPPTFLGVAPLDRFIAGSSSPTQVVRRLLSGGMDPSFSIPTNVAGLQYLTSHGEFLYGFETARLGSGETPDRRIVRSYNHAYSLSVPQPAGDEMSLELIAPAGERHLLEGSRDLIRWNALATNTVPETNRIVWKLPLDSESAGAFFREHRLE